MPPSQVIDTVAIYFDPSRHRKLSLRFLSWFLLKQDIQTAEHDSIEDARCALQLYKKYLDFVEENRFDDVLEDIFDSGQRLVRYNSILYGTAVLSVTVCRVSNRQSRRIRQAAPHHLDLLLLRHRTILEAHLDTTILASLAYNPEPWKYLPGLRGRCTPTVRWRPRRGNGVNHDSTVILCISKRHVKHSWVQG